MYFEVSTTVLGGPAKHPSRHRSTPPRFGEHDLYCPAQQRALAPARWFERNGCAVLRAQTSKRLIASGVYESLRWLVIEHDLDAGSPELRIQGSNRASTTRRFRSRIVYLYATEAGCPLRKPRVIRDEGKYVCRRRRNLHLDVDDYFGRTHGPRSTALGPRIIPAALRARSAPAKRTRYGTSVSLR
jgi:hypothetical protein